MKKFPRFIGFALVPFLTASIASAQTTFTLNGLSSFGSRGDGSIQPGDSIGTSPLTSYTVLISAPGVTAAWFPGEITQDVRPTGSTNGFNMRGLAFDSVSGNLVFVDQLLTRTA